MAAGASGADKCIGKLTLDITGVESQIQRVNKLLSSVGAGVKVDLSKRVAKEVKKQLDAIEGELKKSVKNIQDAASKASDAMKNIGAGGGGKNQSMGSLQSSIQKVTDEVTTMGRAVSGTGATIEKVLSQTRSGYDSLGKKVREVADENGNIVKKVYDEQSAYKEALKILQDYYTKKAQMYSLDVGGKTNTAQYTKLASDVNTIEQKWASVDNKVKQVVMTTQEAQKAARLYNNTVSAINAGKSVNDQETALKSVVQLYQEYYKYAAMADTYAQKGDIENTEMYQRLAVGIEGYINAIKLLNPALDKQAQAEQKVIEAHLAYETTLNSNVYKEQTERIKAYADALTAMMNEQAKFNQQVASGRLNDGTEEYAKAEEKLKRLEQTAIQAGQKLDQAGRDAAMGMNQVQDAVDNVNISMGRLNDSKQVSALQQMEDAYKTLTIAIKNYNIAKKSDNQQGMNFWQNQMKGAMGVAESIEKGINTLNVDAATRQRILLLIEQCKTAQAGFNAGVIQGANSTREIETQMTGLLTRMFSIMAVIRMINNLIKSTVDYVSEYYDKMNEIQIITKKSSEEVAKLGETYRQIAEDMNVSSLEMADAAIYFTRQGIPAAEIEKRLKNVTMYAKTANVEFVQASEIITAVINSLGLANQELEDGRNAAQRVADVFLNVGDNAATSGQEIGEAMQKAAAAAGAYGVSFEWLAAYIASVSETTRQEARTIGTALNTIVARLHSIRTTGFNAEDNTKINDIAKALHTVNIELMDEENNWRDMEDVFADVARVWNTLDGKQKSYIATTMAGVKQQNVFLALMNDMSKGAENGSRAYELYEKALNSAGTAEEKYAIYKDSVTASQERLNIAQEKFYALLDANVIKQWNDSLAGYVNMVTDGAKAWGEWTVILPAVAGAIVAVVVALKATQAAAAGVETVFTRHPILVGIAAGAAALAALVTAINSVASAVETQKEKFNEANRILTESRDRIDSLNALSGKTKAMFDDFSEGAEITEESLKDYNSVLDELVKLSPSAKRVVDDLKNGFIDQKEAAEKLNEELEKQIDIQKRLSLSALRDKYMSQQQTNTSSYLYQQAENWDPQVFESSEAFTDFIKKAYETPGYYGVLGKEANDYIKEQLKDLSSIDYDERWPTIGQRFWEHFFGVDDIKSVQDVMQESVEEIVNDVYNTAVVGLDEVDAGMLRERIIKKLMGEDGIVSMDEWQNAAKNAADLAVEMWANGFEATDEERLSYIGRSLFGDAFAEMFSSEEVRNFASSHPDIVDMIRDAYQELIKAGFDNEDIAAIMDEDLKLYQWAGMAEAMKANIRDALDEVYWTDAGEYELSTLFGDSWEELDFDTLKLLNDLASLEVGIDDIKAAFDGTDSIEGAIENLRKLKESFGEIPEGEEEAEKSVSDFVKEIKNAKSEIANLDKLFNLGKKNGKLTFEDVMGSGLADTHPELLVLVGDLDALLKRIKELRGETVNNVAESVAGIIWGSEDEAKRSPFYQDMAENGIKTLKEYKEFLEMSGEDFSEVETYVNNSADKIKDSAEQTEEAAETWLEAQMKIAQITDQVNWAKSNGFVEQIGQLERALDLGGANAAMAVWKDFPAEMKAAIAKEYPDIIKALYEIESSAKDVNDEYGKQIEKIKEEQDELFKLSNAELNSRPVINSQRLTDAGWNAGGPGDKSTVFTVDYWGGKEGIQWNDNVIVTMTPILKNGEVMTPESLEDYMAELFEQSSNIDELVENDKNGKNLLINVEAVSDTESFEEAQERVNGIDEKLHELQAEMYQTTTSSGRLGTALNNASRYAGSTSSSFAKTYKAIKDLGEGTVSATAAYDTFYAEVDKVTKAQEDINDVTQKLAENTEVAENDVSNLASLLGISADQILHDFPGAVDLFNELIGETGDLRAAFDALNEAAFIRITGTSEADFTNIQNGLIATKNMAQEVIDMLVATGQWAVETVPLDGEAWVQQADGSFIKEHLQGFQQILKPTSNNPYKGTRSTGNRSNGSSNRNTGGGSSRNNDNGMTEVERILNRMEQVHAIQEYQQSFYQAQNANFEQNGYLQGVIDASQKEIEVLTAQNQTLESNIDTIERLIAAKKAELEGLNISSDEYKEVADDLDKLQKAHQNYSKELIENKTSIDKLNESIDEQQKKIRDMQINIRSMIYKAIEDREKKAQDMLNGEIELENKILEIIKKKYEVERDRIIENTEARISALQEERNLLSEQLELRKKMADAEDKAAKLATLEANLKRISADPTRQKEARNIRDQINDLRKEIAWDVAEEEVKAQEDSIDQQITSLEDYKQYVQDYYDDLFKHPQGMIEQMRKIIMGTDEEIIDWLKKNDDDFAKSSEKTQEKMIGDWTKTVDKMRGTVRTYWEEVEKIVAGGDEAIIQFLMENSEDYAKAGKLEAEKYVAEWKKALDDLHKALQSAFTVEAPTYTVVDPGTGGSTGGSTGGGTGGKKKTEEETLNHYAMYDDRGIELYYWIDAASDKKAKEKLGKLQKAGTLSKYYTVGSQTLTDAQVAAKKKKGGKAFKKGGIADYTGFAWMDGSPTEPERVLSPYQTQLFETMVKALEKIQTINVPTMPNFGSMQTGNNSSVSVGDIIVNVDNLDTDDDYEELAKKVGDVLMDKIGRTAVVGGLRINA